MWWLTLALALALGMLIVGATAPTDAKPRIRRDPTWFDHLATMRPTGRRARRRP
ncbi:hypothetical protein [Agromyces sp. NPDC058064]|uniref:hypothetical protein n=1 Tax=Agromyces sp. NPDC058064 TaxID=3346322 RepID=UPI0036DD5B3A